MSPLAVLLLLFAAQAPVAPPIANDEFTRLHTEIVPREQEAWQTIPWRIDLLAARAEALAAHKPLFIWSMNGHPLGCT